MEARPDALLAVPGGSIAVSLRRSRRAKRLSLRIGPDGHVVLTAPTRSPSREIERFLAAQRGWLDKHLSGLPQPVAFAPGAVVPIRGVPHRLNHEPGGRRGVWAEDGAIHVSGTQAHFARRVTDWLRREARTDLTERAAFHATAIGRRFTRVGVRDTVSRWGSCSSTGALSFSWRLVLAPAPVLDYVAAHEVAHLAERNHGPGFWSIVDDLCPDFKASRLWLRRNGSGLYRYGRDDAGAVIRAEQTAG
jgi:predicted metal-dependent hydrolase